MSRYIDKDTLLNRIVSLEQLARKRVHDTPANSPCYERYVAQMQDRQQMLSIIKAMPTADVVEVRHGEWEEQIRDYGEYMETEGFKCSVCGYETMDNDKKYCSECGAKMDRERKEDET